MPIVGFWCSSCAEPADEAHYAPWSPCESGITPGHITNILRHAGGRPKSGWSVTEIKSCLRSKIIERTEDCVVDPASYLKMELGTAHDKHVSIGERVRWYGVLNGLPISGEPDYFNIVHSLVADYKNGTAPRQGVWIDHIWQTSVYGHIGPSEFTRGKIFYNAYGSKAGKPAGRSFPLILGEGKLVSHKIHDNFTVSDNIEVAKKMDGMAAIDYPLTGKSIAMGKKNLCNWCTVSDKCEELDGKVCI